jgi:hypothetical protein
MNFYDPEDDQDSDDEAEIRQELDNVEKVKLEMADYEQFYSRRMDEKFRIDNSNGAINEESHLLQAWWNEHAKRFPLLSQIVKKVIK